MICDNCGTEYIKKKWHKNKTGNFCSRSCWSQFRINQNIHECDYCGKSFYRPQGHLKRCKIGKFCSRECFGLYERAENNHQWQGGKIIKRCEICGNTFEVDKGASDRRKYCSKECSNIGNSGERNKKWRNDLDSICLECGAKIRIRTIIYKDAKNFCDKNCADKYHSKAMQGLNNPRYKDGQAGRGYTHEFNKAKKKEIRERDRYRCQLCWRHENELNKKLSIHHIDFDKKNNENSNLISLCQFCHSKVDGAECRRNHFIKELSNLLENKQLKMFVFTI